MDWNAQIGRDVRQLDRIGAILLALAGLAERAAGAPGPVRWFVLWILRYAEAVATDFVACSASGAACGRSLALRRTVRHGSGPFDAIDLARSLSRLALVTAAMAMRLRRQAFLHGNRGSGEKGLGPGCGYPTAFGMPVSPVVRSDTS
jgi:hypothetical protein